MSKMIETTSAYNPPIGIDDLIPQGGLPCENSVQYVPGSMLASIACLRYTQKVDQDVPMSRLSRVATTTPMPVLYQG